MRSRNCGRPSTYTSSSSTASPCRGHPPTTRTCSHPNDRRTSLPPSHGLPYNRPDSDYTCRCRSGNKSASRRTTRNPAPRHTSCTSSSVCHRCLRPANGYARTIAGCIHNKQPSRGQPVSFHVSGVISGVVPKSTRLGRIVRLPIVIYFLYQPQDVSRPRAALSCRRKKHTCTPQDHPHAQKLEIKVFHVD